MSETCAARLRKALEDSNMTASELARKAGLPKSAISQYLSGKIIPKQVATYKLAKALNVSEPWLMGYDVSAYRISIPKEDDEELSFDIEILKNAIQGFDEAQMERLLKYAKLIKDNLL